MLLARWRPFLKDAGMPDTAPPPVPVPNVSPWDADKIFLMLVEPARRRILAALASGNAQPATSLKGCTRLRLDATFKHLTAMRKAGLLVMKPDQTDGRRMLYSLAPSVPVVKTETGAVIDFGFCLIRL
jgi:DNA-binding transcriptional ArsR family regulator